MQSPTVGSASNRALLAATLVILVSSGNMLLGAQPGRIPPSRWVGSEHAELHNGILAAEIPTESTVGDVLSGLSEPLSLSPGVYRVRAVVAPKPLMNMGYRLVLTVRNDKPVETKRWRPPSSQLTPRPKEIWLAVAEARPIDHASNGEVVLEAEWAVLTPHAYQIAVGWKVGEANLGPNLSIKEAPASLKELGLKSLAVTKIQRQVHLGTLKADKIVYKPGQSPVLNVPVAWTAAQGAELTYRVRMTHDIEPPVDVFQGKVKLAPLASKNLRISLPPIREFGGYRYDLEFLDGGEVITSRERCAICSKTSNRVAMQGTPTGEYLTTSNVPEQRIKYAIENMKDSYITAYELGFWGPDDFQNLTPEKEVFFSMIMSLQRRSSIKTICSEARKVGICVNAYLKGNYADGRDGILWAQKYPELAYYHRDTGQPVGSYNLDHIRNWDRYTEETAKRKIRLGLNWHYIRLDAGRPSIVDISAAETIASTKMFGWGGVRFDGDFDVPVSDLYYEAPVRNLKGKRTASEFDADVTYANNINRYKKRVRQALPDMEFGFNHSFDDSHQNWIATPAVASMESIVMNEPLKSFSRSPQEPYNRWEDYSKVMVKYSRIVRAWSGFFQPLGSWGLRPDDNLYQSIYVLSAQAIGHSGFFFEAPFTQRMPRYIARFAGVLRADLHPVPAPEGRIEVTGSAPLQWKNYVAFRDVSPTKRDYVMHLINPPVPERAKSKDTRCLLRAPVRDVIVSLDLDPFEHAVEAFLLDPWNEKDMLKVPLSHRPGSVIMTLPSDVRIWCTLVLRCKLDLER